MRHNKVVPALAISLLLGSITLVAQGYGGTSAATVRHPGADTHQGSPLVLATLKAGRYEKVHTSITRQTAKVMREQHIEVLRLADGAVAIVDSSLLNTGAAVAVTTESVRISWTPHAHAGGYAVLRDGRVLAGLPASGNHFTDLTAAPASVHRYTVKPVQVPARSSDHPAWSFSVTIPDQLDGETPRAATARQAVANAQAAAGATTTTMSWVSFIPQSKIDAPAIGCSYGNGYQFGGDNRSFDWTSSRYRTALHATITWSTKEVAGNKAVGTTHVYKKSSGSLVDSATASKSNMESYKLGDGSNYVSIRMVNHAKNPYCTFGAIDGAITIQITQGGDWAIRSGSFRRMPNHEMYIYSGGNVTWLIQSSYQSVYCLVGPTACDLTNLTGFLGSYS